MSKIKIETEVVGMLEVNCYLVAASGSGALYIIDPGDNAENIVKSAKSFYPDFKDAIILLTHAHVDHIAAADEVSKTLGASTVYLHPDDLGLYESPENHLLPFVPPARSLPKTVGTIERPEFKIIHTPGHTRGGVCFYFPDDKVLFSGDTIFRSSIGRTDFPGGNSGQLLSSIKERIFALPEDVVIYPGHGPTTRVGDEKADNPFCI